MMRGELAEKIGLTAIERHRTVGNPDAFPFEVHFAGRWVAGGFLGTRAGEKRPVEEGHFRMPGRIRNGDGEEAGVFVVHVVEINALIRAEGREPQTLPVEEVLRYCEGDARAAG